MVDYFDIDLSNLQCHSKEDINKLNNEAEIFFSLVYGIIRSNINTTEKMSFSERFFPNIDVFALVMGKIGKAYSEDDNIEIDYQKPEDKNPKSPTFGQIFGKFVVKNLSLTEENETMKRENKEMKNRLQSLNR